MCIYPRNIALRPKTLSMNLREQESSDIEQQQPFGDRK